MSEWLLTFQVGLGIHHDDLTSLVGEEVPLFVVVLYAITCISIAWSACMYVRV